MTARRADDDQLSPTRCTCHGTGNAVRFDRDSWKRREFEWYYHDDDVPGPRAAIDLSIAGLPANLTRAKLTHHRVDQDHRNAYTLWKAYGSPTAVTRQQYARKPARAPHERRRKREIHPSSPRRIAGRS
jgi:hypothetical protein